MGKVLAAFFMSGCSFVFMSRPTAERPTACTDEIEAPVTDTVISSLALGVLGAFAIDASLQGDRHCVDCPGPWEGVAIVGFFTLPIAAIHAVSAAYGWDARHRCKAVKVREPAGDPPRTATAPLS